MTSPKLPPPRQDLMGLKPYGVTGIPEAARLGANEWTEPVPLGRYITTEDVEEVLLNRYPVGSIALHDIIADKYRVSPSQLVFGNGSNDALLSVFLIFGGHGSKTLLFRPTYSMHARLTTMAGGTVASEMIGLPYDVTTDRALSAVDRERPEIVCICSPNNPTGNTVPDEVVLAIAETYPETVVLVDEAYGEISGTSLLPEQPEHPNLVISKTFSKVFAAAGLRLGFLVLHPLLAEATRGMQFAFNVSAVTYALATQIVQDEAEIERRITQIRTERERVFSGLEALDGVHPYPSEANFILFGVPEDPGAIAASFLDNGVQVRDMSPWPGCDGTIRVTIGTPEENDLFIEGANSIFPREPFGAIGTSFGERRT